MLDDRPNFSFELAPNIFGASSEPASVMEFGFYQIGDSSVRTINHTLTYRYVFTCSMAYLKATWVSLINRSLEVGVQRTFWPVVHKRTGLGHSRSSKFSQHRCGFGNDSTPADRRTH